MSSLASQKWQVDETRLKKKKVLFEMASYMYNPSQKVTEVLSKYLEFDPGQLELGIWSGDLVRTTN